MPVSYTHLVYTLVKIKDEGIGIPQNEYNKIFQRFYRSNHSYVKQTEGSGVGSVSYTHLQCPASLFIRNEL